MSSALTPNPTLRHPQSPYPGSLNTFGGMQFRQQVGSALALSKQACVEGCRDPFTPGPGETSISQAQLSAAARGVSVVPECRDQFLDTRVALNSWSRETFILP